MRLFPSLWRWVPALGILLTVSYPGTAQELPDPALVIAEVLNTHPALRRAQYSVDAAQATLEGSGAQPNPTLTLAATAGDVSENSNALTQNFEISGQPRLRQEQAQARLQAARLLLGQVRRQVAAQVYGAWLELWEKRHLALMAQMRMDLMKEMVRVTRRRFEVGEIPQNESLRVELAATEAEAALTTALAEYSTAVRSLQLLRQQTELSEPAPLPTLSQEELLSTLEGPPLAPAGSSWTLQETLDAAEEQLELAALRQEQKALLLTAEIIGKERAPQLGVSLYRSRFFGNSIEQGAQLSISWPIFDWGSIGAQKKAQLSQAKAQLAAIEEKVLDLHREVAELWNQWRAAQTVRDLLTTQAARYEELARESRIGYDLGLLSLTDVLQTETAFRQAGVELIQAQARIRRLELALLERTNLPWPAGLLEEQ